MEIDLFLIPIVTLAVGAIGLNHADVHAREYTLGWIIATSINCQSWEAYIYYVAVYLIGRFLMAIGSISK